MPKKKMSKQAVAEAVVDGIRPPPPKLERVNVFRKPKRSIIIQIKVNPEENAQITKNAEAYAGGSKSAWVRGASLHFHPRMLAKLATAMATAEA